MNDSTAAAQAEYIDAETTDIVRHEPQPLTVGSDLSMSPGALREQIARHKENMTILKEFVESEMVESHHYYYMSRVNNPNADLRPGEKAALMQDGAFMFINLFKYIPGTVQKNIIRTEDGHFTVEAEAPIYNALGHLVATGDGSCSTRESKYAYRKGERVCPTCSQPAIRKDNKGEGGWYCWAKIGGCGANFAVHDQAIEGQQVGRIDNPDIADVENTVLKVAIKRATVAAARKLPLVSELFSGDANGGGDNHAQPKSNSPQRGQRSQSKPPTASDVPESMPDGPRGMVKTAVDLAYKLQKDHAVEAEDLAMQFLPEGVGKFSDLTEEQAAEAVPALSELLTAKVTARKG